MNKHVERERHSTPTNNTHDEEIMRDCRKTRRSGLAKSLLISVFAGGQAK